MDDDTGYLWAHLIEHLVDAGRMEEAEAAAGDLRWVSSRLERFDATAPLEDLATVKTPRAARLGKVLARTAHVLQPTTPASAVVDVLHSRVAHDPEWGPQVAALVDSYGRARLVNQLPIPDVPSSALRRVLKGGDLPAKTIAIAPDGTWLATGHGGRTSLVHIWDTRTGKLRKTLTPAGPVKALAIAADSTWLVAGTSGGHIHLWNASEQHDTERTDNPDPILLDHINSIVALAVTPDGVSVVTSDRTSIVEIWNANMRPNDVTFAINGEVHFIALSFDGSWLALSDRDGGVTICNTHSRKAHTIDLGHAVRALAMAPDGTWLATGDIGGGVHIWDSATGHHNTMLSGPTSEVVDVAIAPDGRWLVAGYDDNLVHIWDIADREEYAVSHGYSGVVNCLGIAPDGTWLAINDFLTGSVHICDPISWESIRTIAAPDVHTLAISPDGNWLATGGTHDVDLWDLMSGEKLRTFPTGAVNALAVSPQRAWLATDDRSGRLHLWDIESGVHMTSFAATYNLNSHGINVIVPSPYGTWLVTGDSVGNVCVWNVLEERFEIALGGHVGVVRALAVSPDGTWLVTGDYVGNVYIWSTGAWRAWRALPGHTGPVRTLAVSKDGAWLATGSDHEVRIWDTASWQVHGMMRLNSNMLSSCWLADNIGVVVGSQAGLHVFDFRVSGSH